MRRFYLYYIIINTLINYINFITCLYKQHEIKYYTLFIFLVFSDYCCFFLYPIQQPQYNVLFLHHYVFYLHLNYMDFQFFFSIEYCYLD